jgi:hypothetical protein
MDAAAWATWAGAAVALGAAVFATIEARRATAAANRSARANERSADAAEQANVLAEEQAAKYVPVWSITRSGGDQYLLTNGSKETAFAATITQEDGSSIYRDAMKPQDLSPGESLTFFAPAALFRSDTRFLVTWRRTLDSEPLTQRHPLPPN